MAVPLPTNPAICRVTGAFKTLDDLPTADVETTFTLVDIVPPTALVKTVPMLVARRFVKTRTDDLGRLAYDGHEWLDLVRNDFITPPGTSYRIQNEAIGLDETVSLTTSTFDMINLAAITDTVGFTDTPANQFDFSVLPGNAPPVIGMYMAPRDLNTMWCIVAGDTEWTIINRSYL